MAAHHTPGPWKAEVNALGTRRVFTEHDRIEINGGPGRSLIACLYRTNFDMRGDTDMANARVLAAAPDLLDACLDALNVLECNCSQDSRFKPKCKGTCTRGVIEAAIAKATKEKVI